MTITLSRRNLLTLLHRLVMPYHEAVLYKPGGNLVIAEDDVVHYKGRAPGPMRPQDEQFITLMGHALKLVKKQMEGQRNPAEWITEVSKAINQRYGGCSCRQCEEAITRLITDAYRTEFGL